MRRTPASRPPARPGDGGTASSPAAEADAQGGVFARAADRAFRATVLRHPRTTLVLIALLVTLAATFARDFEVDVSSDSLVLERDADLAYYRATAARYGSDDFVIVTYTPHGPLFAPESLADLRALRDALSRVPGVRNVTSVLDVPLLRSPPVSLAELADGWRTLLDPDTDLALAQRELRESPLYADRLLSRDAGTTAIQVDFMADERLAQLRDRRDALRGVRLNRGLTPAEARELDGVESAYDRQRAAALAGEEAAIAAIRAILDRHRERATLHLGGVPMIAVDMMHFIRHDLLVFGIAVVAILALLLGAFFRSARWVLLPLLNAFAGTLASVGLLAVVGWPLTVVSSNFVALLLIFSLSLSIHLVVRYRELQRARPHAPGEWLVRETVRSKFAPSLYTVLTTMVAFASLVVSGIRPGIDFGWIMVAGLTIAFILVFTLLPGTLLLLGPAPPPRPVRWTSGVTAWFARRASQSPAVVIVACAVLAALSAVGMSQLAVENRFIDYFDADTEIHRGLRLIDEKLGGTTPLDVIVDAPPAEAPDTALPEDALFALLDEADGGITARSYWFNAVRLEHVRAVHRYLESLPQTGKVLSLATALEVLAEVSSEADVRDDLFLALLHKRLPPAIRAQLIDPYLSADGRQVRFAVRVFESDPELARAALLDDIRAQLTGELGLASEQVHLSGMLVLYNNLLQSLFRSQILTLGAVFGVILLTFAVVFRSWRVAGVAIVPNVLAAAVVLGLLGGAGIPLDIMTITIAAITIGIAVDDTIHYVHRYREEWQVDGSYAGALARAHASIGLAMYYTTMTVTVGFAVLAASNFTPTIYFGVFTALAMLAALVANLLLLPVLLKAVRVYGEPARGPHSV